MRILTIFLLAFSLVWGGEKVVGAEENEWNVILELEMSFQIHGEPLDGTIYYRVFKYESYGHEEEFLVILYDEASLPFEEGIVFYTRGLGMKDMYVTALMWNGDYEPDSILWTLYLAKPYFPVNMARVIQKIKEQRHKDKSS